MIFQPCTKLCFPFTVNVTEHEIRQVFDEFSQHAIFYQDKKQIGIESFRSSNDSSTIYLQKNLTAILPSAQRYLPELARICIKLNEEFSEKFFVNLYLSKGEQSPFPKHYDGHDIVVYQIFGRKEWLLFEPSVENPVEGSCNASNTTFIDNLSLNAGECLFIPRGIIHETITTSSLSIHASFGIKHNFLCDVIADYMRESAEEIKELRVNVSSTDHSKVRAACRQAVQDIIQRFNNENISAGEISSD